MTTTLLLRLNRIGVEDVLSAMKGTNRKPASSGNPELNPAGVSVASSGGTRASEAFLIRLRSDIIAIAQDHGFPDKLDISGRSRFDTACAVYFAELEELQSGETLRNDVWAFITCVLLRNVTAWRFPVWTAERFHGGDRNMFQRLWYRAITLDRGVGADGRWELVEKLTEDAFAQIIERPSVRADRRLARAIAEGWLRMHKQPGGQVMERIMRRTVRNLRMRNEIQLLSVLSNEKLNELIDRQFQQSLELENKTFSQQSAREQQREIARTLGNVR